MMTFRLHRGKTKQGSTPTRCYHCFCSEPQRGSQHAYCSHHSLFSTGLPAATLTRWRSCVPSRYGGRWPRHCKSACSRSLQLVRLRPRVLTVVRWAEGSWTVLGNIPERYPGSGWPQQTREAQTGSPCNPPLGNTQFETPITVLLPRRQSRLVGCSKVQYLEIWTPY